MVFCWHVNGPPLNTGLVAVIFRGSGAILLGNPLFCDFSGESGPRPPPPPTSGSAHCMHLKEGTCLKCSVIIGGKVRLDYNSWYACLPLIRHVVSLLDPNCLQTLITGCKSSERERGCTVFAHETFVLALFLRILKHNVWVSQSILLQLLPMRTPNPNLLCASAFVRQSQTFHSVLSIACTHF